MLKDKYPKSNGKNWTTEEIDEIRKKNKFSENLKELVEKECKKNISKPTLGFHLAKSIEDKEELSKNLKNILKKLNLVLMN